MSSAAAAVNPPLLRMSTAGIDARLRPQLVGDVMARQLAGGMIGRCDAAELNCDWQLAALGPGTVLAAARQAGLNARREGALLRDGDDDVSIFFARRGVARFDQNDRRLCLAPGHAVIVAHSRSVASTWPGNEAVVLRLPRAAFAAVERIDDAGGLGLDGAAAATRLLTAYVDVTMTLAGDGKVPAVAARHLAELASGAVAEALGAATVADAGGARPAVAAARVAAMLEVMRLRFADPRLSMAAVARSVGMSERSGYLAFAALKLGFTDELTALRLDRAREALLAGYPGKIVSLALAVGFADLSHFNRRLRERFGATPGELRRRD